MRCVWGWIGRYRKNVLDRAVCDSGWMPAGGVIMVGYDSGELVRKIYSDVIYILDGGGEGDR